MGCASLEFMMTVSDTGMSAKPRQWERTNLFLGINFNKKRLNLAQAKNISFLWAMSAVFMPTYNPEDWNLRRELDSIVMVTYFPFTR